MSCSERLRPHSPDKDEDSDAGNEKISVHVDTEKRRSKLYK